ncbi:MAG: hypothetical protein JNJ99_02425 [Crocinitomicaceae bacterium]|nr:hypothetical protein [Crocinitomicaceae bacterium]
MDKKIRNRILYITVAILWGFAIYRTYSNYTSNSIIENETNISVPGISPVQFKKDTFELVLPDSDPFLRDAPTTIVVSNENRPTNTVIKNQTKLPPQTEMKIWPTVEYFGFVKNINKNSTLCLLKVNGKQIQISKGDSFEGIILQQASADSIVLKNESEYKSVFKKSY